MFQLYSLFLTAAAGYLTEGRGSAAAWAGGMHAGTQAMQRWVAGCLCLMYNFVIICITFEAILYILQLISKQILITAAVDV